MNACKHKIEEPKRLNREYFVSDSKKIICPDCHNIEAWEHSQRKFITSIYGNDYFYVSRYYPIAGVGRIVDNPNDYGIMIFRDGVEIVHMSFADTVRCAAKYRIHPDIVSLAQAWQDDIDSPEDDTENV